jgi:8-oxo-dGTP diphosphatase
MNEVFSELQFYEKEPPGFSLQASAVGCYVEIEGKLLLLQYSPPKIHMGKWDVPGGMLEQNETLEQGALRELFEETGIFIEDRSRIRHVLSLYIRGKLDYLYHQFQIQLDAPPSILLSREHQNYVWASPSDMKALPLVERADDVLTLYRKTLLKKGRAACVNAYLLLRKENKILFSLRQNTGYCDGMWGFVAGHVENGEPASVAICREAREEIGLSLHPSQIKQVHAMHRKSDRNNIDIFFDCSSWEGTIVNGEKDKCADLAFFPLDALPSPRIDSIDYVLSCIEKGQSYSEYGWYTQTT